MGNYLRLSPGLFGGVSQQAPAIRLEHQAELQENALGSVQNGLNKRPCSEYLTKLTTSNPSSQPFVHTFSTADGYEYLMVLTGDPDTPIEIVRLTDGVLCTVEDTMAAASEYWSALHYLTELKSYTPRQVFQAVTVSDTTWILNSMYTPAMRTNMETGFRHVFQTMDAMRNSSAIADEPDVEDIFTGDINTGVITATRSDVYLNFALRIHINTLYKTAPSGVYIPATVTLAVRWRVSGSSDPWNEREVSIYDYGPIAPLYLNFWDTGSLVTNSYDFQVEIIGGDYDGVSISKVYYQHGSSCCQVSPSENQKYPLYFKSVNGVLEERCKFGNVDTNGDISEKRSFVPATMPHKLVRVTASSFAFYPGSWDSRVAGDSASAPEPSFVGTSPNSLFFYQNRLGVLCGNDVVMSRTGDYGNFWPGSAMDIYDTDPLDVSPLSTKDSLLLYGVPYRRGLMLFGAQQQFLLHSGENPLTPNTVAVEPLISYDVEPSCIPVTLGGSLYFAAGIGGAYRRIREYFMAPEELMDSAEDITQHTPQYIPAGSLSIVASPKYNLLFVHSTGEASSLFVNESYWRGQEKLQNAWSKWTFHANILGVGLVEEKLVLLLQEGSEVTVQRISLDKPDEGSLGFPILVDRKTSLTGVYDANTNTTTWTLPVTSTADVVVVDPDTGMLIGESLTLPGDWTSKAYLVGVPYTMRYRFSEWFARNQHGIALTTGRLQCRALRLSVYDTGYLRVEVTPDLRDTSTVLEYNGMLTGRGTLGSPNFLTGEQTIRLMAKSRGLQVDLVNDSHLDSNVSGAGVEAMFHARSKIL